MAMLLTFPLKEPIQFCIGVSVCLPWYHSLTIEEIALVLQYLANLEHPDLTDSGTHWMKGVSLQGATWWSGGECELAGIFWMFFQAQPAHLKLSDSRHDRKWQVRKLWFTQTFTLSHRWHIFGISNLTLAYNCDSDLDAVLKEVSWSGEALLFVKRFAKDNYLFKQEHSSLLHPGQKPSILIWHHKGVLEQQSALCHNFTLKGKQGKKRTWNDGQIRFLHGI